MTTATSPQNLHPRRAPDREDDDHRYYDGVAFASDVYVGWVVGKLRLGKPICPGCAQAVALSYAATSQTTSWAG